MRERCEYWVGETPEIKPIPYNFALTRQPSKVTFLGSEARLFLLTAD